MKKLSAFILGGFLLISIATAHFHRTFNPYIHIHKWPLGEKAAFVISCDDISAGYPLEYFEEIQSTLNPHGVRATFFVIPYHGEWDLLTDSPPFVEALHTAEDEGHEIALHGYAHYEDEFVCSPENQKRLLEKALSIMQEAGFTAKGFRAPCLKTTPDTLKILKEYNFVYDSSFFGESGDVSFEGELPQIPSGYEYSWYITEKELNGNLARAKLDFLTQYQEGSVFSLVTHMKAVNEGEGITFLEDFLDYVDKKEVWNATLLELVEWEIKLQEVTWQPRKTITGGEITFDNIPQGLVVEIRLPLHYYVKGLPQGVEVATKIDGQDHVFTVTFDQHFEDVVLSFILDPGSPALDLNNELLIFCGSGGSDFDSSSNSNLNSSFDSDFCSHLNSDPHCTDFNSLKKLLSAWEINHRVVEVNAEISTDLLGSSFIILVDKSFLKRSLTIKEKILLYSLENRVIVFSDIDPGLLPQLFMKKMSEDLNYVTSPLEAISSQNSRGCDLGYYTVRILKGKNTVICFETLHDDSPRGLYYNLLVRSLFICKIPVRKPFFSLEIDDCAMYEIVNSQGNKITADITAYRNSLDLASSYNVKPIYGFTSFYFPHNSDTEKIFSLLKRNNVLVANHGYEHCLDFADPETLAQNILQANTDIESMWGEPPHVILVPCHKMHQKSMVHVLEGTPIQAVGTMDKGYTFGVFKGILFYERTSLQLPSDSVDDAPPFLSLFLYSHPFSPSIYAVTHIFNYIGKGASYQYIDNALKYLVNTGHEPSDTETMAEENFFWSFVDLKSFEKDKDLVIELSGLENHPKKEYTVHFMMYGSPRFRILADSYLVDIRTDYDDIITYVTVVLQPEMHK